MSFKTLFSVFFCFLGTLALHGQDAGATFEIGTRFSLQSEILGQERPYIISLPESYEESEKSYPVLYLLDGGGNFHHTTASVIFLSRGKRIPEMIVVGIPNTDDRARDLTPEAESMKRNFPTSGGADNMLEFIEKELMPAVSEKYRTTDYKMLVGHSFGGLFAIHTMLNHPGIFDSYLAISPSLWWDQQSLVKEQSEDFFENQQDLVGHLYMTIGNEGGDMLGGAWKLSALLEENGPRDLNWEFKHMPDESHGSVPFLSTYEGLLFVFEEWNTNKLIERVVDGGVLVMEEYEQNLAKYYGLEPVWEERVLLGLSQMLMDQEQTKKAMPILQKVTDLFPESSQAWFHYGESLSRLEMKTDAIVVLKHSQSLDADNFQPIALLHQLGEDVSDLLPSIELSKQELKQYVGDYKIEDGPMLKIDSDGKILFAEAEILPKEAIVPLGDHTFYVISKDARITFTMENEKAIEVLIATPDASFVGKRE